MDTFNHNLDELLDILDARKDNIVRHLKKNYQKNIQFITINAPVTELKKGGLSKINYMLTDQTYELLKNSFNFRTKYLVEMGNNIQCVNSINMCIESQTIGFIANTFNGIVDIRKQHKFGNYKVDLYFPKYNIVVECDENGHMDRDESYEVSRENFIKSLGNTIIRFNPNTENFDLSTVLQQIIRIIV